MIGWVVVTLDNRCCFRAAPTYKKSSYFPEVQTERDETRETRDMRQRYWIRWNGRVHVGDLKKQKVSYCIVVWLLINMISSYNFKSLSTQLPQFVQNIWLHNTFTSVFKWVKLVKKIRAFPFFYSEEVRADCYHCLGCIILYMLAPKLHNMTNNGQIYSYRTQMLLHMSHANNMQSLRPLIKQMPCLAHFSRLLMHHIVI